MPDSNANLPRSAAGVLVCFAVPQEASRFRKLAGSRPDLEILLTGIGARNARATLLKRLESSSPQRVITSGFAGALNPALEVGTVVFDCGTDWDAGPALERLGARRARFLCSDTIVAWASAKSALWHSTGDDAVEMESQHLRHLCQERGIPSATVRVISDGADEDLPLDFNALLNADQTMNYGRLAAALMRHPAKLIELLRFQRRIARAAESLAQTLAALLEVGPR